MRFKDRLVHGIILAIAAWIVGSLVTFIYEAISKHEASHDTYFVIVMCCVALMFTQYDVRGFISDKKNKKDSSL